MTAPDTHISIHIKTTEVHPWTTSDRVIAWPENVTLEFPDGSTYDEFGARNAEGESIATNPTGRLAVGSPCWHALHEAGMVN